MTGRSRRARTRVASGLFLCVSAAWLGGCQLAGVPVPPPEEPEPVGPVVAPGPITEADQQSAAELMARAEASFEARRFLEVLRLTDELVAQWPASAVSGAAVLLSARAERELGSMERADAAAERYIALLPEGDADAAPIRLFQAEVLADQPAIQLDRLLRIGGRARPDDVARALDMARQVADTLSFDELLIIAEGAPRGGPAAGPVYTRLAVELLARGEEVSASEWAASALDAGASGADLMLAEGVLRGELPEELRPVRAFRIATVLPFGGPPALAEFAELVAEGVEVAVATVLGGDYDVTVVPFDDEADPVRSAEIVEELEVEGYVGAIGFLQDEELLTAGVSRQTPLALVSPTARSATDAGGNVYSLEGADPAAARDVAFYAADRAHQRVAMVYPNERAAIEEADAFQEVASALGIEVVGRFPYQPGATDFGEQFLPARDALRAEEIAALGLTEEDTLVHVADLVVPVGLFMPIPPEDVEFVAPQFAHHGLDTLAIEVLGTTGWTDPQALEDVDPRLLEGVVATAPVSSGTGSPGYDRFTAAYEEHFQRSLVSSTPQLGYDAALLLLEALRPGRVRPQDVRRSFQDLSDLEGATGILSVTQDRVVRRTRLVRIVRGALVPVPVG